MPVAPQTHILSQGLFPLFNIETAPDTTKGSAQVWAQAYSDYLLAGGIPAGSAKIPSLSADLEKAFNPELAGGGPPLFLSALSKFWVGLAVPAQAAIAVSFTPSSPNVNSPQPDDATPREQSDSLANIISSITLASVKVQLIATPFTILPLL